MITGSKLKDQIELAFDSMRKKHQPLQTTLVLKRNLKARVKAISKHQRKFIDQIVCQVF
jgi:hypothetical protein